LTAKTIIGKTALDLGCGTGKKDLQNLFSGFRTLKTNVSKPKTKPQYHFIEILFQKE